MILARQRFGNGLDRMLREKYLSKFISQQFDCFEELNTDQKHCLHQILPRGQSLRGPELLQASVSRALSRPRKTSFEISKHDILLQQFLVYSESVNFGK